MIYKFPPYKLDSENQSLLRKQPSRKEVRLHLPPKAFSVLQYLVECAGKLVTHNELLEKVWPDTFVQPEVLSSHIRDIRAALGDDARNPRFIETLSRRGYRFIASLENGETAGIAPVDIASHRIVGREAELAQLHHCYRAAMLGKRQLVFVTGEPGIGKTALCREFLHRSQTIEASYSAWGQCIEGYEVQEPYSPLLKAIGQLCRAEGESIIQIFKMKAPTCVVQFSDLISREERIALEFDVRAATGGRMLREVLDALEAVSASKPLILVLDDLQWGDRATVDVISEFARRHQAARILLLGTFRPLEAFLNGNPVTALKEELLAHRLCSEINLAGLAEIDISEFLGEKFPQGDLLSGLASLLYRRSEGNPLFMVAALEHSLEQGSLIEKNGLLQLGIPLDQLGLDIPHSLRRIIEAQVDHLEMRERRILEVASVQGLVFSPSVITSATDYGYQEVEDVCHELASRKLIIQDTRDTRLADDIGAPCYQFVHVLYRDVLYERQAPGRRSLRHQLIGTQLESLYEEYLEEVSVELALHFEHASDWNRTVSYLRLAAENSERRYAHPEAIALLMRALDFVGRIPEGQRLDAELKILDRLATIYVACFDPRCVEAYERVSATASALGLAETSAQALLNLATCLLCEDAERCLQTAERASQVVATLADPLTKIQLEMSCRFLAVCAGGWNSHEVQRIKEIFHQIRGKFDKTVLARQVIQYGIVQWASSNYKEASESILAGLNSLSTCLVGQNPYLSIAYQKAQFYLPRALFFNGEWGKALSALDASLELADKNGECFPAQMLRLIRAWIHFHAMDFQEALVTSEPLITVNNQFGGSYLVRFSRLLVGSAQVALGDHEHGLDTLMKAQEEMNSHLIVFDWCFRLPLHAAFVELWLAKGELQKAHEKACEYLTGAWNTDDLTYSALALEVNARVSLADGNLIEAVEFILQALRIVETHQLPLAAWHVHATAAHLYELTEEQRLAQKHRETARMLILSLADSLGQSHPLRQIFLSSATVSRVLNVDSAVTAMRSADCLDLP